MKKEKTGVRPVSLDSILIAPKAYEKWQYLARRAAKKLSDDPSIAAEDIGLEQAEVNPDGSLTIYAEVRGKRVVVMRLKKGEWAYAQ